MSSAAPSVIPAQFGVPPYTDEFEGPENNTGLTTSQPSSGSAAEITGIVPFKQTDVIYQWIHEMAFTTGMTVTASTDTNETSPYYPWVIGGVYRLNMQQQYPAIDVISLIDLAVVSRTRPLANAQQGLLQWWSSAATTGGTLPSAGGYLVASVGNPFLWPYNTQVNAIDLEPTLATGTAVKPTLPVALNACVYFDAYWELTYDGLPISGPHNGYVSPQDMAGYARVVTPDCFFNPLRAQVASGTPAGLDFTVVNSSTGNAGTYTPGVITHRFQRVGVLGNTDPEILPGPTNWQYNIAHQRTFLAGRTSIDIPLNGVFLGQIMGIFVRLYDPSAGYGGGSINVGSTISVSAISKIILQYGGNSIRFQGLIQDAQRLFVNQHRFWPPEGYLILDLATDRQGWTSNAYLLNTLREAGVILHLDFTSAQSTTAYAEVVIDGLRWVPLTPVAMAR